MNKLYLFRTKISCMPGEKTSTWYLFEVFFENVETGQVILV